VSKCDIKTYFFRKCRGVQCEIEQSHGSSVIEIVVLWLQLSLPLCPLATTENSRCAAQAQQEKVKLSVNYEVRVGFFFKWKDYFAKRP
jgi:hypothetical protein